ncbi:uncharacterized protein LOC121786721 [Salvia splendens]|uniref:uncharacterized protein LOC121786721 n=1 Tax=Salvia splendens TaxID=180675 RepID=UPI001C25A735|nr:uncharacterized protein LOC121786721 [Salvia splendens]
MGLFERLDRVLVSEAWTRVFEATRVTNLPRIALDHGPVLARCKTPNTTNGGKAFRFQNMWIRHGGFMDVVQKAWEEPTGAGGLLNIQIKHARVKRALKEWNKEVFGNIHANLKNKEEAIALAQSNFEAALRWLAEGDKNTRFYQSWVKQKRVRLRIHSIRANGQELTEEAEIKKSAVDFFQQLLAPSNPPLDEPDLDLIQQAHTVEQFADIANAPDANEVKNTVISPNQSGFVKGRLLNDNALLAQEMFHELARCSPAPNVEVKIDMAKAYDRVQWPFLFKVLRRMGFPDAWISLMERCIGSCWFSILINGAPSGFFRSTRGLRQGDPISPALFVIAAEYLSRALDKLILGQKEMTFKASRRCQQVSLPKSNFYIADAHEQWANSIQEEGGFSRGDFPFLYLGVPIYRGVKRTDMFLFLREKIARRISGWAHRHLSFGGRLTLIKSTLAAIPLHIFQAIEPTAGTLKHIDQQMARFFWGSTSERKRTHWIGWDQMCLPTDEGGLGIRKTKEVLRAFNIKLWWRFREQNSLWAKYMMAKYYSNSTPLTLRLPSRSSPTWRRLSRAWTLAQPHIRWLVGQGNIYFWDDIWVGNAPLKELSLDERGRPTTRASEFIRNGVWDVPKLQLLHDQAGLPQHIIDRIINIPILHGEQDIPRWTLSNHGEFTMATTWETIRGQHPTIQGLSDDSKALGMNFKAANSNGKIWFFVEEGADFEVVDDSDQILHGKCPRLPYSIMVSAVYAKCTRGERVALWDKMREISVNTEGMPWIIGGNFNTILSTPDRAGSDTNRQTEMIDFAKAIEDCRILNPGYDGSDFTWAKNGLFERLDRVLVN